MAVHNHRPWRPMCSERTLPDGTLRGACLTDAGTPVTEAPVAPPMHDCGWPEDTFPCRIRHQHLNTGAAKAAHD